MTIIAGAMSRNGGPLPDGLRSALVSNLSRNRADVPEVVGDDRSFLAKVDIGALGGRCTFAESGGSALVLAGEPILSNGPARGLPDREAEGAALFADLRAGRQAVLEAAAGTFCAAFLDPRADRLLLVADKLGVRPIYYVVTPDFVAFASALRIVEAAGLHRAGLDERGTWELCAFGYPLGERTCYRGVRVIGAAEIVEVTPDAERHRTYFEWDRLGDRDDDEGALVEALVEAFAGSVRARLRSDRTALAFLSGGLDSRAIVAALRNQGADVLSLNFAPPDTQDRRFAELAAATLGSRHRQLDVPLSRAGDFYRLGQIESWLAARGGGDPRPERPRCIWSGDGGSVGMGHVYMDDATVALFERGDLAAGVRSYLRYNRLPGAANRALTGEFRRRSRDWHVQGATDELTRLRRKLDGRTLHLFLMLNDQRRHMARHYEVVDLNRFEFLLPFFDSDLLEIVVRHPVRPFMRHVLYHAWLRALSPASVTVPWQTYPGHEPCPVPFAETLRYQWGDYFGKAEDRRLTRKRAREALRRYFGPSFPGRLVSRANLGLAIGLGLLGIGKLDHLVRVGDAFVRFSQESDRRGAAGLPGLPASDRGRTSTGD